MSFVSTRLASLRVPFANPNGKAWTSTMGAAQDAEVALLRAAGVARSTRKADDTALVDIGSLYNRPVSPRESYFVTVLADANPNDAHNLTLYNATVNAYRARCASAWPFWEACVTVEGLPAIFAPYASSSASVPAVVTSGLAAGLPGWSEWSVVWLSDLAIDGTWDDGDGATYDDGGVWDLAYDGSSGAGQAGIADLDYLRRDVRRCKAGTTYPVVLAIALGYDAQGSSCLWDDGGKFDDGGVWDDTSTAGAYALIPLGHVWDEETSIYDGPGGPGVWDGAPVELWDDGTIDCFAPPSGGW